MSKLLLVLVCLTAVVYESFSGTIDGDLLEWKPPKKMSEDFPYHLAGETLDSPIWVVPYGTYPLNDYIKEDKEGISKYVRQLFSRVAVTGREGSGSYLIVDLEGFGLWKNGDAGFIQNAMKEVREIFEDDDIQHGWIINGNFFFSMYWAIGKGKLGTLGSKIDYYSAGNEDWKKDILEKIPKSVLPKEYGGKAKGYEETYGR